MARPGAARRERLTGPIPEGPGEPYRLAGPLVISPGPPAAATDVLSTACRGTVAGSGAPVQAGGMSTALAWLQPGTLNPLVVTAADGRWLAGPRYDGILGPTVDGQLAAVDLLGSPDGRAAVLADAVPPGAVVARLTAAWVHTGRHRPSRLAILVPVTEPRCRHPGPVHRQHVRPMDIGHYGGVAVTTPLRTAVDLLCFDTGPRAAPAVAALLHAGLAPDVIRSHLRSAATRVPSSHALRRLAAVVSP